MYWLMQQIFARRMSSSCKNGFPNRSWPSSSFLVWVSSGMNVWDLCLVSLQFAIVSAAIRRQNISREQVTVTICRRCNNHYSTTSTTIATRTCCDNSGSKVLQLGSCRIRPDKAYVSWCYPSLKWCVLLWKFANVERIQTLVVALVLPGVDRSVDRPTPSSVWRQPKNAPKLQSDCWRTLWLVLILSVFVDPNQRVRPAISTRRPMSDARSFLPCPLTIFLFDLLVYVLELQLDSGSRTTSTATAMARYVCLKCGLDWAAIHAVHWKNDKPSWRSAFLYAIVTTSLPLRNSTI